MALFEKLSLKARRMLVVPFALAPLALAPAALAIGTVGAEAAMLKSGGLVVIGPGRNSHGNGNSFAGNDGPVADTCTASDELGLCDLDDFVARCDAAGGGLSTLPGGGVDCDTSSWDE